MRGNMFLLCLYNHRSVPNYELFQCKWRFGLFYNFGRIAVRSVFYCGLSQDFKFSLSWLFQGARRLIIRGEFFFLSLLNLKGIPYIGDFPETLDRVHVKYFMPKGAFMFKTAFVQKVSLISLKGGLFASVTQDTNVIGGLKLLTTQTNVTTMLCAQGEKLNLD